MNYLETIGVIIGLAYLYLEYKANKWLWVAGIIMPSIYIFVYFQAGFYADMGINIYYLVAGVVGLVYWLNRSKSEKPLEITHTPFKVWPIIIVCSAILWLMFWWILTTYTDSTVALGDSFTTALSVVGLWMLTKKYVEQWLVWILVDLVCSVLYIQKELDLTGYLYALYTIIAIFGYFKWRKMVKNEY